MPRLTESTRQKRREQIADAAFRCFGRRGFADTSMADIIEESGMSAGSIYSHFAGKADLIRFVASGLLEAETASFVGGGGGDRPVVVPSQILGSIAREVTSERAQIFLQVWSEVSRDPEIADLVADQVLAVRNRVAEILSGADDASQRRALVLSDSILAIAQGLIVRVGVDPAIDRDELILHLGATLDLAYGAVSG